MSNWKDIAAEARRAAALLVRDRQAGESEFERLLARYADDPMIRLERGKAYARLGEIDHARVDLEFAESGFPRPEWRQQARALKASLPSIAPRSPTSIAVVSTVPLPDEASLRRATELFYSLEPRAVDFDVAARLLEHALAGTHALSPAVPVAMLLQSWNFAYYQQGRRFDAEHFERLEGVLRRNRTTLDGYRQRDLRTEGAADESSVKALFQTLADVAGRVGAAKVLHLWAPRFFPMWDNPIARAYGFDLSDAATQYCAFMQVVAQQVVAMSCPSGMNPLKSLDEYNYCRYTKEWLS